MPLSPLFVFNAGDDDYDVALVLASAWAEAVSEQCDRVDEAERRHSANLQASERGDYDVPPDCDRSFRVAWVANHTLIWMSGQLLTWLRKIFVDFHRADFEESLRTWRNALEHLNEALIRESVASPDPELTRPQSISSLGTIRIGNAGSGTFDRFASTAQVRGWVNEMLG